MNPHALRHRILSPARLPFRHSRARGKPTVNPVAFKHPVTKFVNEKAGFQARKGLSIQRMGELLGLRACAVSRRMSELRQPAVVLCRSSLVRLKEERQNTKSVLIIVDVTEFGLIVFPGQTDAECSPGGRVN